MSDHTTNKPIDIHKPDYEQKLTKAIPMSKLYDPEFTFKSLNTIFKEPQDETLPIRERALKFFSDVIGNDDIKEKIYRALLVKNRIVNIILIGPPATCKTELFKIVEKKCNGVIFFDAAAGSSDAGLIRKLENNKNANCLIIDEVTEMKGRGIEVLRGLLNDGRISKTLSSKFIDFKMSNIKIFMTTNNPKKLSQPIKSRCQIYYIDGYSDEEFIKVLTFCLIKQKIIKTEEMAKSISYAMQYYGIKNIRTALSIASMINVDIDTADDIKRLIESYIRDDGSNVETNFNEEQI
jgi:replication-associated recombination protein RarA